MRESVYSTMQTKVLNSLALCLAMRKRLLRLLMVSGLALGVAGCSTPKHADTGPAHSPPVPAHYSALELNQGKKWAVPAPMMVYLRNLEQAVQKFDASQTHDHAALAKEIEADLGGLVTHCTMEGKAHDELHKWLMPFLGFSAEYSKATDPQVQQQKLQEIQQALLVLNRYFE